MTESSAATARTVQEPAGQLEPDAIGVTQDTVIGMASSAPAAVAGLTLASLAAATAYGSGPILLLCAIPMLIIANAYRRLNMWSANCGASFEWVGRAINPYLGFLTGWLMVVGYILGTVSGVEVLGPSVLAVFGSNPSSVWPDVGIAVALGVIMLVIAAVGIRLTARTQVGMAVVEYAILVVFALIGLAAVFGHHSGTVPMSGGWFSLSGIGGRGSAVAGLLIAVFAFSGWDGAIYVNEEVKQRRTNPGRAAVLAVLLLAVLYTLVQVGLQGAVPAAKLRANSADALVYVGQALGGNAGGKALALSLALSVIATTGAGIVVTARIMYGMARRRVLPPSLASVSPRFATPVAATVLAGLLVVGLSVVYLLATSVQNAFDDVVAVTGLLFAAFYILTGVATVVYYRRRVVASAADFLVLGLLPVAAAGFLGWIIVKSVLAASAAQQWSLAGIAVAGLLAMALVRVFLRPDFFRIRRESDRGEA